MGVAHGGFDIFMAHQLLHQFQILGLAQHPGSEGVGQIVEAKTLHPGVKRCLVEVHLKSTATRRDAFALLGLLIDIGDHEGRMIAVRGAGQGWQKGAQFGIDREDHHVIALHVEADRLVGQIDLGPLQPTSQFA
jgi:hypothetical protein